MRKTLARAVVTGALTFGLAAVMCAATRSERLVTGEQRVLKPGYAIGDIAISNPKVCDYRVIGGRREVMLIANGVGFTTLTIWDQQGVKRDEIAIEVLSAQTAKLIDDLTALVRPYPNVTVKTLGPRIVVSGTVDSRQDLDAVKTLAAGAGALCTVTALSSGQPTAPTSTTPRVVPGASPTAVAAQPAGTATGAPAAGSVVHDPTPPPATRKPVNTGSAPVSLGGGAGQPGVSTPATATPPPVAVPAAAAPPPPNVVTDTRPATPAPAPVPALPASAAATAAAGEMAVEYLIVLYESPSSGPPPEVAGPQGKRLFEARLRTAPGLEVRQTINVGGSSTSDPATMRGLSIALTPRVRGNVIDSSLVFDTNLPLGRYDQKKAPVWLRSQLRLSGSNGQTRYVTEQALAAAARPTGADPATPSGPGAGSRIAGAAGAAIKDGVSTATRSVPGSSYVPSLGGLFGGGARNNTPSQPKARPTMLLLVITPAIVGSTGRDTP